MSAGHVRSLEEADDKYIHMMWFNIIFTEYTDQSRYNRSKLLII